MSTISDQIEGGISSHLRFLFSFGSKVRGYVSISLLDRNPTPPKMTQRFFSWPVETDELVEHLMVARKRRGVEVFISPYLFKTENRTAGNTSILRLVHADVDKAISSTLQAALKRRGFRLVGSGTADHFHVYGRLSRAVTAEEHRGILVGLRAKLGGDNKISDNDLLRVPWTTNWKNMHHDPAKRTEALRKVRLVEPGRRAVDVDSLLEWLGNEATPVKSRVVSKMTWDTVDITQVPSKWRRLAKLPTKEAEAKYSNRHNAVWGATKDMARAGLSPDTIHTLLNEFPAAIDKADEEGGYDVHSHIDRALDSLDSEVEVYEPGDDFWGKRPYLKHVKEYAIASMANPWATLGVVLVRVLHHTPPRVLLPGRNNSEAGTRALNLYVALIGKSGAGKKTATDAGEHAVDYGIVEPMRPIGSGEGIPKSYRRRASKDEQADADGMKTVATRVIFDVPEVSTWNSLTGRSGATLVGEVLKGFSGENLGMANGDDLKTNLVPKNSYRMGLVLGAQPGTCGPLLADKTNGLPQRFLWMPSHQVVKFDYDKRPTTPSPMMWTQPEWPAGAYTVQFCEAAQREIWDVGQDDTIDELDAQSIVIRMRIAAAFAFLDGRRNVEDEDWELSRWPMVQSVRTRGGVLSSLAETAKLEARKRGIMNAQVRKAEVEVEADEADEHIERVVAWIVGKLGERPRTKGWLNQNIGPRQRNYLEDALNAGQVLRQFRVRKTASGRGEEFYLP